ncbi:acyltransferase domain-containing protein, partial [Streptomyces griseofuscus]|uniref:acyltransferase domain-containing protein n=1 Tax=Streptomyces griseofuscus TaxID=146922 RepID=UPI0036747669
MHFTEFNPQIDASGCRLRVPTSMEPWPVPDGPRLAAVSSYGVGGTNAHAIVEAAEDLAPRSPAVQGDEDATRMTFLLSGSSPAAARRYATRLADWLESDDGLGVSLEDIVHTLAVRRSHGPHRIAVVADSPEELAGRLRRVAAGQEDAGVAVDGVRPAGPGPVFVYSGHGSQWAGMCRGLLDRDRTFTTAIDALEPLLRAEGGFSLREVLTADEVVTGVARVQPTLFAVQVALTAMWRERGVEPVAVIGHSMGEVAAAVACGALSMEDGARVICRRARLLTRVTGGAIAAVQLAADQVRQDIAEHHAEGVEIAVIAAPRSTVVSGDAHQVEELVNAWDEQDVGVARVRVDVASHSAQMEPILEELRAQLVDVIVRPARCRFYSTVVDDPRTEVTLDADYWAANQRQPVRFAAAVEAAGQDGHRTFVEVNVHPLLAGSIAETLTETDILVVPTIRRDGSEPLDFATHVAALHCAGLPVPWERQYAQGRLAEVPATCWEPAHYWIEPSALVRAGSAAGSGDEPPHPLLGSVVNDPERPGRWLWQCDLSADLLKWLRDHHAAGVEVMPGAAWAEMALSAARAVALQGQSPCVRDVTFAAFLPLAGERVRLTSWSVPLAEDDMAWQVVSHVTDAGIEAHSHARLTTATEAARPVTVPLDSLHAACSQQVDVARAREGWKTNASVSFGPAFDAITSLHTTPNDQQPAALAHLTIPDPARAQTARFQWHPALLDGCLQSLLALWTTRVDLPPGSAYPLGIGELQVHKETANGVWCYVRAKLLDSRQAIASVRLLDADGAVVAHADDIHFAHRPTHTRGDRLQPFLHQHLWQYQELTASPRDTPGTWLTVTEKGAPGWHEELLTALGDRGATVVRLVLPVDGDEERFKAQLGAALTRNATAITDLMLIADEDPATDDRAVERAEQRVTRAVIAAIELDRALPSSRLHLIVHNANQVNSDHDVALAHAGIRGLHRVLTYEHPGLRPVLLDTDTLTALGRIADQLLADDPEDEIAWRTDRRHVARLRPSPLTPGERRSISVTPAEVPLRADADGEAVTYTLLPAFGSQPDETPCRCRAVRRRSAAAWPPRAGPTSAPGSASSSRS